MACRTVYESVDMKGCDSQKTRDGERFRFGKNWERFLRLLTEERIKAAETSLIDMVGKDALHGERFLDIGCGSGLFSLAARRLGANVTSFDYDEDSVRCAQILKTRFYSQDDRWTIIQGSVLDSAFMEKLGQFKVVYAWGVLHHTGNQWKAVDQAMSATKPGGTLLVALYNDQGWVSHYWTAVKWIYTHMPVLRPLLILLYVPYFIGLRWLIRLFKGQRVHERGMSLWHDMIDWIGGWPFEVAAPREVLDRARQRGFTVILVRIVGRRQGCNEFVLARNRA